MKGMKGADQGGLFAIADLHLSFARPKPMSVFGVHWADHAERLARAWRRTVSGDDLVLVGGDLSWAMKTADALPDLDFLAALPGVKLAGKGNHDYWWPGGAKKLSALERPGLHFLDQAAFTHGPYTVAGTRLWDFPECAWTAPAPTGAGTAPDVDAGLGGSENPPASGAPRVAAGTPRDGAPDPEALRAREMRRLRERLAGLDPSAPVRVCLLHYPPLGERAEPTALTRVMDEFRIDWCVFGHIHGVRPVLPAGADVRIGRTRYVLSSVDQIGFAPKRLV